MYTGTTSSLSNHPWMGTWIASIAWLLILEIHVSVWRRPFPKLVLLLRGQDFPRPPNLQGQPVSPLSHASHSPCPSLILLSSQCLLCVYCLFLLIKTDDFFILFPTLSRTVYLVYRAVWGMEWMLDEYSLKEKLQVLHAYSLTQ